jgi:pyruvate/2-oxoglutarate/acetoin dehydrogenase E1 component
MTGMRPVPEIMQTDFFGVCLDQIANQAGQIRYMFGGKAKLPLVIRTAEGGGRGAAAHHSQCLEAWILHSPGLLLAMPATPYDAKGLLKTAIRCEDPVVFIEHKMLYRTTGPVPEEDDDYTIPFGVASIPREGTDATVVAVSAMVPRAVTAADKLAEEGISVEADPHHQTAGHRRICNRSARPIAVIVHEARPRAASGEIACRIMRTLTT